MPEKLLKNIILILLMNIIFCFFILYIKENTRISGHVFDDFHLLFMLFLVISIGFYHFKESYIFLLILLGSILVIGLIAFNFFINDMDACPLCGLRDSACPHDCDGACYGWYTFENEKEFLFLSYIIGWLLLSSSLFFTKKLASFIFNKK